MKYQCGFTLVELIMTLVIIGILAAVVGPRFFDRGTFDERIYFEEALSAVRYAQKLAVASDLERVRPAVVGDFALIRRVAPGPRCYTATRLLTGLQYSQMLVNSGCQPASIKGPADG